MAVLAVFTDKKFGVPSDTNSSLIAYYEPHIITAFDYYPFGMMSRMWYDSDYPNYRFGFNGKEMDHEAKGNFAQLDYGFRIYDPRIGRFLSVDPLGAEYPWNSSYAYAENDVIRSIDLDGLEKYILSTDRVIDEKTGKDYGTFRHLKLNRNTSQWNKGLIGHYDANGKLTIIDDPNLLSEFDQRVYNYALDIMKQRNVDGGLIKLPAETDIGIRSTTADPFEKEEEKNRIGYRKGTMIKAEPTYMYHNLFKNLDIVFNLSKPGNNPDGASYANPTVAQNSIKDFAKHLLKNGINRVDLGISTRYSSGDYDSKYGNAENLLKARASTVVKSFSQFGISVNKINFRYVDNEPSVWGTSSTQIKVLSGWNVSQIPVQQKLVNGKPTGPVTSTGRGTSPKFVPNTGQPAPKSRFIWK